MDDSNDRSDDDDNDDNHHRQAQEEENDHKAISIIGRKKEFSFRTRSKIDVLVERFLQELEDDVHELLCNNMNIHSDDYCGLDSDRDTEAEVEIAVRFFPDVLSRKGGFGRNYYPIQCISFGWDCLSNVNVKAVAFIPPLARLAIELGSFEEEDRGGLLCKNLGKNVLQNLMNSDKADLHNNHREYHEVVDDKYLQVLIRLGKLGHLKKEDIQRYSLLNKLCFAQRYYPAEKRFRFLVEWDPNALTQTDEDGDVPLHDAVFSIAYPIRRLYQHVFDAGIQYFPKKKGIHLFFHKDRNDDTPFQDACKKCGYKEVMNFIEETLVRYLDTPINTAEALLLAAIDENIHLDCVYFLLRRQPDILQKLPSSSSSSSSNDIKNNYNGNIVDILISETKISPNKRKRNDMKNDNDDKGT